MNQETTDFKTAAKKVIEQLREELKTIRSGKATPTLIEGIVAEVYGGQSKLQLKELATIAVEGGSVLIIVPFDPSTQQDIEKAILKSPLGITPQPQGSTIRINVPPLSEEQREKIIKMISSRVEEKKVVIRNVRDEARKKIKHMFEAKTITEDDKFRTEKDIDTATQDATSQLQTLKEQKVTELREI